MKMKKILPMVLILGTAVVYADDAQDLDAKRMAWSRAYLEKQGMPVPDSGVKIVPEAQMANFAEKRKERIRLKHEIQGLGYIKSESPTTQGLLTLSITAKRDLEAHGNDGPQSTHLKKELKDVMMAYPPTEVPASVADEYIGAAPYLTYVKDQGWTGVIQFFTSKAVGNCAFSENNIKLNHAAAILAKEDVRNDVNGKATMVQVMGMPGLGFTYTVEWFDSSYFRKVECASAKYSPDTLSAVISIASKIDANG